MNKLSIQIASDLHFEFYNYLDRDNFFDSLEESASKVDVLVLAGDIVTMDEATTVLPRIAELYEEVVYVVGNHEYYGSGLLEVESTIRSIETDHSNFHWLADDEVTIKGQRFLGGTLWFPEPKNLMKCWQLNDYRRIRNFTDWVYKANTATVKYLEDNVCPEDIVITHHLPSFKCVHPRWAKGRSADLNVFYANPLDYLLENDGPKFWFHGHTHESNDLQIGDTRVVCNPFGYLGYETNNNYSKELIIEVE